MVSTVAGIILAGGQSRRMGRDKALLPLPGNQALTFVGHLAALLASHCQEVIVVARDAEQAAGLLLPGVQVVTDQVPDVGPLMGIYSGLSAMRATYALVTAVDMPFVQPEMVSFLLSRVQDTRLLVPVVEEIPQVLLAVYSQMLLPTIIERLHSGRRDPRSLLDSVPVSYIEEAQLRQVDPQLRSFINLNTPNDLSIFSK